MNIEQKDKLGVCYIRIDRDTTLTELTVLKKSFNAKEHGLAY